MPKNKAHKKCMCDQKSMLKCLIKGQTHRETQSLAREPVIVIPVQPVVEPLKDTPSLLSHWEGARDIQAPAAEQRGAADRTFRQQWLDADSILVTQPYRDSSWPTILRAVSRSHHMIRDGSEQKSKSQIILKVQFSVLCLFPDYYI